VVPESRGTTTVVFSGGGGLLLLMQPDNNAALNNAPVRAFILFSWFKAIECPANAAFSF
jgi:hypothetical protein